MDTSRDERLTTTTRDGVRTVQIGWAGQSALFDQRLLAAIGNELRQAAASGLGAVVLASEGPDWCLDLAPDALDAPDEFVRLLQRLHRTPLLTVGALDGRVAGAGLVLALAMDLRLAAPSAVLRPRGTGGRPSPGSVAALVDVLGEARAKRSLLLDVALTAQEAAAVGMVDLAQGQPPLAAACSLARQVLGDSRISASMVRRTMRACQELPPDGALEFEAAMTAQRWDGDARA